MTIFTISIVSDSVCPWCYIGHRRLQAAIAAHAAQHPDDVFRTAWRPFQLNPDAPRGTSFDKAAYMERKFGAAGAARAQARLRDAAAGTGIAFDFGGRTGNTLDSHRLIARAAAAGKEGLQTRVVEELFADYFERAQDITDHGVLARAAGRAGLDEEGVRRFLAGEELAAEVAAEAEEASGVEGIHGVPHFTINDAFEVEGGQEPAAFLRLFQRLKQRESKA